MDLSRIALSPELSQFAEQAIADGRYRDIGEAVESGLRLLKRREEKLQAFQGSLDDAVAEADRDGWLTLDEVLADMDKVIATLPE